MPISPDCQTRIKLTIVNTARKDRSGFGQGSATLLRGVEETGSLNMAAKRLGMAYSKAWRLIKDSEEELGMQLLDRDGARGSTLTKDGKEFLTRYDELNERIKKFASDNYRELIGSKIAGPKEEQSSE